MIHSDHFFAKNVENLSGQTLSQKTFLFFLKNLFSGVFNQVAAHGVWPNIAFHPLLQNRNNENKTSLKAFLELNCIPAAAALFVDCLARDKSLFNSVSSAAGKIGFGKKSIFDSVRSTRLTQQRQIIPFFVSQRSQLQGRSTEANCFFSALMLYSWNLPAGVDENPQKFRINLQSLPWLMSMVPPPCLNPSCVGRQLRLKQTMGAYAALKC